MHFFRSLYFVNLKIIGGVLDYFGYVSKQFEINAIGVVRCSRSEPEDDSWDKETSRIELSMPFNERSLLGLADFSHCIVVYVFDKAVWDESTYRSHSRTQFSVSSSARAGAPITTANFLKPSNAISPKIALRSPKW
ncbi:MAG: hypothetical protein EBV51_08490 [Acidimicrobiia bacterium]|nr:hypothetical protein [Acidimicrobiia bacterium]